MSLTDYSQIVLLSVLGLFRCMVICCAGEYDLGDGSESRGR